MKNNIAIVGAGVSGLVAALYLEKLGYAPTIYEASKTVGGRVKSDIQDGYILDHGFQVLLSQYPIAQKYLDYKELGLIPFESGAYILKNGRLLTFGDPFRDISFLWNTLFSPVGKLFDKWKIFKLSKQLKNKSLEAIFASAEVTTLQYLKDFGFSEAILNDFFIPFFGGIFLEQELATSSRMFEFVFKMFSEGNAVVPKKGMQAIPDQLESKLKNTTIHFSKKVAQIKGNTMLFEDNSQETIDFCIVATEASQLIPNMSSTETEWKGTQTLYFEVPDLSFNKHMIGLVNKAENSFINSICFPKSFSKESSNILLSVSVIKNHSFSEYELLKKVKEELHFLFEITPMKYLKTYDIPRSLPQLTNIQYTLSPSETQLTDVVFMAGDTMLNGSLNAAMHSGELAAEAVHEKITGTVLG